VIISISILSGFGLFKLHSKGMEYKSAIPYLLHGEAIDYFDLLGEDSQSADHKTLQSELPSLIFIFDRPCSPCNKNLAYWKRIAGLLEGKVNVYGIVLGNMQDAFNFSETSKLNFGVFVPKNVQQFVESMRIKINLPQTIIYHNNKVQYIKLGNLNGEEATDIIKTSRTLG
ncbi:MAG: hypothetical protein GY765_42855, partial [bacterium]|nr:hypothetical protein [bacterium]